MGRVRAGRTGRVGARFGILTVALAVSSASGCVCQGQRMALWDDSPPEAQHVFVGPEELDSALAAGTPVAWVLRWDGEWRPTESDDRILLVCRFFRLDRSAREKLLDMRFAVPLEFRASELHETERTVLVSTEVPLESNRWAAERRGPLGLYFGRPVTELDGSTFHTRTLPCAVRLAEE